MKPQVKHINYGIACRINNTIYIHRALRGYPILYNALLRHEEAHSRGFSWKDIIMDIDNTHIHPFKGDYYSFILKHPSSWTEFLPFWIYDGKMILSPMVLLVYIFSFLFSLWITARIL